jgi:hypothetical protein
MKHARLVLALLVTSAAVGVATRAYAAPPIFIVTGRAASDHADELVKRALALGDQGRYADAEPLLREAWGLKHAYDIAANLALVEAELGHWRGTAEHMTFALKSFPANGGPEHRALGETTLTKALTHVAALTIRTNLDKADVLVDSERVGVSPLADVVYLDPGPHVVTATLSGYPPAQARIDARAGTAPEVTLSLAAPPTPPGGGGTATDSVRKPILITGTVIGGVGVVLGAVFAGVSSAKASDAATQYDTLVKTGGAAACGAVPSASCQALESAGRARATFANASAWSFVAGGAVGVATAIYALAGLRSNTTSGTRVTPTLTAGGGGVVVQGAW